ncbi:pentapeptide repeat-containing protein [Leptothoe sp. ISB3NOV94-8A]|uniref:Pentapeptide repeat-containing protein n=1 Tax=Adonisia turfae CCMR0081 TaxID=2292702 RepID=A0A6M0RHK2_9CYAN|nr:pentapeptide repeat-containing protein [Adonisia turfae]MDV3352697.1 pentapeptide repeat-containing protein [Leptothoe sp. LEGE 181152]NEZ55212.1 hypothetical protein [Adonisia turfae CCMR0081]
MATTTNNVKRSDFRGFDFSKISGQKLKEYSSRFSYADLRGASFKGITLEQISFSDSLIHGANFQKTRLINVSFDRVKAGFTRFWFFILRLCCIPIGAIAGLICGYSSVFMYGLASVPIEKVNEAYCGESITDGNIAQVSEFNSFLGFIFVIIFFISIVIAIYKGTRAVFAMFIVGITTLSFLLTSLLPDPFATTSILGFASVMGGLVGIITQSQVSYLNLELDKQVLKNSDLIDRRDRRYLFIRRILTLIPSILGAFLGAMLSAGVFAKEKLEGESALISALLVTILAIGMLLFGEMFANDAVSSDDDRRRKHPLINQAFDSLIRRLQTSFSKSSLTNVYFRNAVLRKSDFSNVVGSGIINVTGSDREDLSSEMIKSRDEGYTKPKEAHDNGKSQTQSNPMNFYNSTVSVTVEQNMDKRVSEGDTISISKSQVTGSNTIGSGFSANNSIENEEIIDEDL